MFQDVFVEMFKGFPPEFSTFFISMIPVAELRASIPIAIIVYKLPILSAIFFSVIGEIVPVFFILIALEKVHSLISKRQNIFKRILDKTLERTHSKFEKKYLRYGSLALVIFVAIPLPFTGAWSGAVAAFLFRIHFLRAFLLISMGVMISAVVVTLLTITGIAIF